MTGVLLYNVYNGCCQRNTKQTNMREKSVFVKLSGVIMCDSYPVADDVRAKTDLLHLLQKANGMLPTPEIKSAESDLIPNTLLKKPTTRSATSINNCMCTKSLKYNNIISMYICVFHDSTNLNHQSVSHNTFQITSQSYLVKQSRKPMTLNHLFVTPPTSLVHRHPKLYS